jgi:hypothetical protein
MKRILSKLLLALLVIATAASLISWGTWGHQHINRAAVFALPDDIRPFFYNHIDFITEESTVPDLRKYTINDKAEFNRHYINPEAYSNQPLEALPQTMQEAKARFADSSLQKSGILPWYMQEMMEKLTTAFRNKQKTEILFLAGDLAHYIGDAHMPLHTALNHDGQLTNQRGIHSFWESQLPEMFGDNYNFYTGPAVFIPDVKKEIWRIISASHQLADTLLLIDRQLKTTFPADKIYEKDAAGNVIKNKYGQWVHTHEHSKAFHDALHGMVERQLRLAIAATANLWYTAWVNAGKPDLRSLDPQALTKRNKKYYDSDIKLWKKGKLFGFNIDKEY